MLGADAVRAVGFDDDQGLLEYEPRSFLGYRLLQEYFVLPEKFLFVDLVGLDPGRFDGPVDIRLHLRSFGRPERAARLQQTVGRDSFRLHCTPIVNLFKQQAEPIRLTQELHEYPVVADARRPLGLEVYSIDSVRKASRDAQQMTVNEFLPFFSIRHGPHGDDDGCFWYAPRKPSLRRDDDSSEMSITLVDRPIHPRVPSVDPLPARLSRPYPDLPAEQPSGCAARTPQLEASGRGACRDRGSQSG